MNYGNGWTCEYSGYPVPLDAYQLDICGYVECPKCGSIRTVKTVRLSNGANYRNYPIHDKLVGTARVRDQWWKQDKDSKQWAIVQKSEVK